MAVSGIYVKFLESIFFRDNDDQSLEFNVLSQIPTTTIINTYKLAWFTVHRHNQWKIPMKQSFKKFKYSVIYRRYI